MYPIPKKILLRCFFLSVIKGNLAWHSLLNIASNWFFEQPKARALITCPCSAGTGTINVLTISKWMCHAIMDILKNNWRNSTNRNIYISFLKISSTGGFHLLHSIASLATATLMFLSIINRITLEFAHHKSAHCNILCGGQLIYPASISSSIW